MSERYDGSKIKVIVKKKKNNNFTTEKIKYRNVVVMKADILEIVEYKCRQISKYIHTHLYIHLQTFIHDKVLICLDKAVINISNPMKTHDCVFILLILALMVN